MGQAVRVLVVDDEPNIRLVFKTALEPAGYEVSAACDGHEALERQASTPSNLILLDLRMPGMGGMEVLRKLRERHDATPVVVITAHGNVPDAVEAMKLGAIDFLSKPLSPDALRRVVFEVISRHAAQGAVAPEEPEPRAPSGATAVVIGPMVLDLTPAKRALNLRQFDRAAELLEDILDHDPDSVEANTLLGVLYEGRGQNHAAYHAYKTALTVDPHYGPARDNMARYCEKHGLDVHNRAINPAAD